MITFYQRSTGSRANSYLKLIWGMPIAICSITLILLFVLCGDIFNANPKYKLNRKAIEEITNADFKYPFRFVIIGDVRTPGEDNFSQLRQQINRLDSMPSFCIVVGDLVAIGEWSEYRAYTDSISKFKCPVISVIGNHEMLASDGLENYRAFVGDDNFYFDCLNLRFICLNNAIPSKHYSLSIPQLNWLEKLLVNSDDFLVFIFMHVPMDEKVENYSMFKSIIAKYKDRISFLCFGHEHLYRRYMIDEIPCIVSGGGGAPLEPYGDRRESSPNFGIFYHFIVIDVLEIGKVIGQVVQIHKGTNSSLDYNFTLEKPRNRSITRPLLTKVLVSHS